MKLYLKRIVHKFKYAFSGCFHGLIHDKSIRLQFIFGFIVIVVGSMFSLSLWEWCILLIVIFLVIAFEFVNSALEHTMDMISPNYHPTVKIIKDYAAAAVLMMSILAAIIGILIFGGKLL